MKPTHQIVLTILAMAKEPINYRQVFERMEPSEKGKFDGLKGCNGVVSYIGSKGWADSIPSSDIGDSSHLWVITEAGLKAIAEPENVDEKTVIPENVIPMTPKPPEPTLSLKNSLDRADDRTVDEKINTALLNEYDNATAIVRSILVDQALYKRAPKISEKNVKIGVLKHFAKFCELVNVDFQRVLLGIISDLENLESTLDN